MVLYAFLLRLLLATIPCYICISREICLFATTTLPTLLPYPAAISIYPLKYAIPQVLYALLLLLATIPCCYIPCNVVLYAFLLLLVATIQCYHIYIYPCCNMACRGLPQLAQDYPPTHQGQEALREILRSGNPVDGNIFQIEVTCQ